MREATPIIMSKLKAVWRVILSLWPRALLVAMLRPMNARPSLASDRLRKGGGDVISSGAVAVFDATDPSLLPD